MKIPWGKINPVASIVAVIVGAVLFSDWLVTGASWLKYLILCFAFAWVLFLLYAILNAFKQHELKLGVEFDRIHGTIQILSLDVGSNYLKLSTAIAQLQCLRDEGSLKPPSNETTSGRL